MRGNSPSEGSNMATASEYVSKMQMLISVHGDLECVDAEGNPMGEPEFNDDDEPCFVLADVG